MKEQSGKTLDSVSPETPIRDVVDRCSVWESHADPAVRRISKPNPDPTYLAYAVGDTDSDSELPDETGPMWCASPVGSQVIRRRVARTWMRHFRSCSQDGGQKRRRADLR